LQLLLPSRLLRRRQQVNSRIPQHSPQILELAGVAVAGALELETTLANLLQRRIPRIVGSISSLGSFALMRMQLRNLYRLPAS
jgi:hypothetical protein